MFTLPFFPGCLHSTVTTSVYLLFNFFKYFICLLKRGKRGREIRVRETENLKWTPQWIWSWCLAWSQNPVMMTWANIQSPFNQLNHPGAHHHNLNTSFSLCQRPQMETEIWHWFILSLCVVLIWSKFFWGYNNKCELNFRFSVKTETAWEMRASSRA